MNKTKIDWADSTWNPVTGCLHGCEYCYARGIAHRFGSKTTDNDLHILDAPVHKVFDDRDGDAMSVGAVNPYPFGFAPTFHHHHLSDPARRIKPTTYFVCSMADLFGYWVPDEEIFAVRSACYDAPQHRYLFLTKAPDRYVELWIKGELPWAENHWFGASATDCQDAYEVSNYMRKISNGRHTFLSVEPILENLARHIDYNAFDWIIVGAETGKRKGKVIPQREWVEDVTCFAHDRGAKVFMKESLRALMGDDFMQEFPWEV